MFSTSASIPGSPASIHLAQQQENPPYANSPSRHCSLFYAGIPWETCCQSDVDPRLAYGGNGILAKQVVHPSKGPRLLWNVCLLANQ